MEVFEKPTETLSGDKSLDQDANEGSKAAVLTVEKPWENGKMDSCIGEDDGLEDSEMNGVSSLLQMKESVGNIDVNGGSGEVFGTLLGAVDQSKETGVENVLSNGTANLDEEDNGGKMIMNEIEEDDGDGEFSAGYFVWGKIKSHPWWPGQVYSPTDASDHAVKLRQKGRILVAYFGDSSFAWCHSSQLKPFEENFEDMLKLSSSKNFVNAVSASVDEIGRLVESKMTCLCVPKENCVGLDRPLAENAGIKEGVLVPEGGIERVSVGLFEPKEVLDKLKQISQAVSTSNFLEYAVLKGWLSAYNRSIGRPQMPMYYEPLLVPDIEENVGNPITRPVEEDSILRHPEISEDTMHQRRKQKSIAEILKADIVQAHEVTKSAERASSSRRKRVKDNDKANGDGGSNLGFVLRKGMGTELSGSHVETDVIGAKEELDKGYSSGERKMKSKQANHNNNNGDDRGKEDTDIVSGKRKVTVGPGISRNDSFSRERKKSKYLSPPYTSSTGKLSKSDIEDESIEVSNDTRIGETMTKATGNHVSCEMNELPEEVHADQEALNDLAKLYLDRVIDLAKVEIPANEVLVAVRSIALSPHFQRKNSSFELTVEFLSVFRSSVYQDGSDYEIYNQFEHHKKRKSADFLAVSSGNDRSTAGQIPSGHKSHKKKGGTNEEETKMDQSKPGEATWASVKKTQKLGSYKPQLKQTARAVVLKKNDKKADENDMPASLFATFGPGSSLPTKDDLIRIYSKYGAVDMEDTDMFHNNFCARVVFLRTSDAEAAFSSSLNDSPFGSANVSFRLRLHQAASAKKQKEIPSAKKPSPLADEGIERSTKSSAPRNSQFNHIKQKLEMLTSMLETSYENMSSETKSKIQSKMRGLLEVVNTMVESSS